MDNNENIPVVEATNVSKQQTTQEPDIQLIIQLKAHIHTFYSLIKISEFN